MSTSAFVTIAVFILVAISLYQRFHSEGARKRDQQARPGTAPDTGPGTLRGPTLSREELDAALEQIDRRLEQFRLEYIAISPQPKPALHPWQSKFGGRPYWPRDLDYPRADNGRSLFLLAQLNFEEIPELPSFPGLPDSGLLQFFITDDDLLGLPLDGAGVATGKAHRASNYRVVYHPVIERDTAALEPDVPDTRDAEFFPLQDEYALTFSRESGLPALADYRFGRTGIDLSSLPDEVMDELFDRNEADGSRIGGYANFTQDDPREGETENAWPLLFQMDSESREGVEILWGDAGVGNFFIRPQDLARRDFSRVWYNWDCC
ncbi:YwqG family protein [Microbulbifer sp. M83]|uniref:YwqG family protein n=1 Tax=Microbulbifer sp. M83 TaxID=3118246 RepID=UPI002FE26E9E